MSRINLRPHAPPEAHVRQRFVRATACALAMVLTGTVVLEVVVMRAEARVDGLRPAQASLKSGGEPESPEGSGEQAFAQSVGPPSDAASAAEVAEHRLATAIARFHLRYAAVRLLQDLRDLTPAGLALESLRLNGDHVLLHGHALRLEAVLDLQSQWCRHLSAHTRECQLLEVQGVSAAGAAPSVGPDPHEASGAADELRRRATVLRFALRLPNPDPLPVGAP